MKKIFIYLFIIFHFLPGSPALFAQESIFTGFKSDMEKADAYYRSQAYPDAIRLYERLIDKNKGNSTIYLKLANALYMNREMTSAVSEYNLYEQKDGIFNQNEIIRYASALQATGDYDNAVKWFQKYLDLKPNDREILKRIWQLQNIEYLYEDSIHYTIHPISINTQHDELCPAIYKHSLVFISNREEVNAIQRIDATKNKPFYRWHSSNITKDSIQGEVTREYEDPKPFGTSIHAKYHKGSISFFPGGDSMVYVRTSFDPDNSGESNSQIFFARKEGKHWKELAAFPYNSLDYSVNHPALTENGNKLYFSSDMPGGFGGMDIYISDYINGQWSEPVNMGAEINTSQNENYPVIQNNKLYFSSDGHPGLGGFDIFIANDTEKGIDIHNMGYPANTNYDDFGLVLDKTGSFGYLVSNRNQEINNDNIFEIYINKPSYPLLVSGSIRYRNTNLKDSTAQLNPLVFAELELIDFSEDAIVEETSSDAEGDFTIEIPYEGQFKLRVTEKSFGVAVVSMEIPRNPEDFLNYEIVIVKELFKTDKEKGNNYITKPEEGISFQDQ